ncbi:YqeG family HAD IIIA-type phosphatase [Ligilactobacillus cholophilus]|uniref:YqeG family HAD IIIA-type phosphatase n=1 Tax=Ligilactobacillus cholophilus TaxID=3050131 RepID=UPI0025AF87B0|nr:YqeG family HAD IIIA-type phosphatase [Ligilactobacillus cholophilus]
MLEEFKPTWMLKSIYNLTPDQIRNNNIKLILTDLDNTLIAWNNPDGTPELKAWLKEMKDAGIPVVVVSNNNEERVKKAVEKFDLPYISRAMKPLKRGINIARKQYDIEPQNIVLVGDQLMTDVLAANRSGIKSILVKPIVESDAWNTKFNRFLENIIKNKMIKKYNIEFKWEIKLND